MLSGRQKKAGAQYTAEDSTFVLFCAPGIIYRRLVSFDLNALFYSTRTRLRR